MITLSSPLGLHRVIEPPGVLPQAAWRLDASPAIAPDEVRIRVDRLNLDAASYRQLREAYSADPDKIRRCRLRGFASPPRVVMMSRTARRILSGSAE